MLFSFSGGTEQNTKHHTRKQPARTVGPPVSSAKLLSASPPHPYPPHPLRSPPPRPPRPTAGRRLEWGGQGTAAPHPRRRPRLQRHRDRRPSPTLLPCRYRLHRWKPLRRSSGPGGTTTWSPIGLSSLLLPSRCCRRRNSKMKMVVAFLLRPAEQGDQ